MAGAGDRRPKYREAWGEWRPDWQVRRLSGSVPVTSASPWPTPSGTTMSSAISQSGQHDDARLRPLARFLRGTSISGRVKDRDINLAGHANRSARCARSPFKVKAGRRRPSQRDVQRLRVPIQSQEGKSVMQPRNPASYPPLRREAWRWPWWLSRPAPARADRQRMQRSLLKPNRSRRSISTPARPCTPDTQPADAWLSCRAN